MFDSAFPPDRTLVLAVGSFKISFDGGKLLRRILDSENVQSILIRESWRPGGTHFDQSAAQRASRSDKGRVKSARAYA
jgi:hypothetical protein